MCTSQKYNKKLLRLNHLGQVENLGLCLQFDRETNLEKCLEILGVGYVVRATFYKKQKRHFQFVPRERQYVIRFIIEINHIMKSTDSERPS